MESFKYQLGQLAKFLEKSRIDYAVLGGIAVSVYSEPRMTQDIDFIIAQNPIEFAGIKRARLKSIWGVKVKIVTAADLFVHKFLSERPRDREDARGIILRQGRKLDLEYVDAWLKKIDKLSPARHLHKEFKELVKTQGLPYFFKKKRKRFSS
jgi:hypothetical protein